MKKMIAVLMALVLCVGLCACGDTQNDIGEKTPDTTEPATVPIEKLALGDVASTDIVDFTLDKSQFTIYVSNVSDTFAEPTDEPNDMYAASVGYCYVSLTFTITNKDRGGHLDFAGTFARWDPKFTVSYNGNEYNVNGFDLNDKAGFSKFGLGHSAVLNRETGMVIEMHDTGNELIDAGETITFRSFGVIDIEPEKLTDGYDLTVSVPNSKGEYECFTYTVPAR